MPLWVPSSTIVMRAVDILTAAGFRVHHMQGPKRIDRDEYEVTIAELIDRREQRKDDIVLITDNHEDHGRVTLRREAGVFTSEAEDMSLVRPWGTAAEQQDD